MVTSSSNTRKKVQKSKKPPLQFKRGTYKAFRKANPILAAGQPAAEIDTHRLKIGDGVTPYRYLPYISEGEKGQDGKSAYQLWRELGNSGTIEDFLEACTGQAGKSAYDIWKALGNEGDEADFLISLQGKSTYDLWIEEGNIGSVSKFIKSLQGKSAYDIWLSIGNEGTEIDFINSLKGDSAYQVWLSAGNEGTVADYLASLKGEKGESVYELYLASGGTLTEEEFQNSLVNPVSWGTF